MTTDTTPAAIAALLIHNGQLFIDSDGDICVARSGDNLVACAAYATFDVSAAQLNLDVFKEMVERFNAFPALAAERDRLAAKNERLRAALLSLLRFAENTESELGIVLGSADLARAALKGETQ